MDRFIDAHCHYAERNFCGYRGAGGFVCNAAAESEWGPLLAAARQNKNIYAAIGVHPWFVRAASAEWQARLATMLRENPNVMVGEIGLDRIRPDFNIQMSAFCTQMKMAAEFNRPAHIHCVRAWDAMLGAFKMYARPKTVLLHRFDAAPEIVRQLSDIFGGGVYFSFRAPLGVRAMRAIGLVSPQQILVETDGDAPAPDKIWKTTLQVAAVLNRDAAQVANMIYNNTLRMLKNGQTE